MHLKELLDQIFGYLFDHRGISVNFLCPLHNKPPVFSGDHWIDVLSPVGTPFGVNLSKFSEHLSAISGIFFVNRQIRHESLSKFFKNRMVCISADSKGFNYFVGLFGRAAFQYVTRIHITYPSKPYCNDQQLVYECPRRIKALDEFYLEIPDYLAITYDKFVNNSYPFNYWDARIGLFTFLRGLEQVSNATISLHGCVHKVPEINKLIEPKGFIKGHPNIKVRITPKLLIDRLKW